MGLSHFEFAARPLDTSTTGVTPQNDTSHLYCVPTYTDKCRIWAAIKRETLLALSEGVASPQEIDAMFKNILKTSKGPCEQMDVVGLDVVLDIENHYRELRLPLPNGTVEILEKMKAENKLGLKSGVGFYNYQSGA